MDDTMWTVLYVHEDTLKRIQSHLVPEQTEDEFINILLDYHEEKQREMLKDFVPLK